MARVQWRGYSMALQITPAGLFNVAPEDAQPDLLLEVTETSALALAQVALRGDKPSIRIEGDVQLAADINWLVDHVEWDVEEDLARIIGDAPAHTVAKVARSAAQALRQFVGARMAGKPDADAPAPEAARSAAPASAPVGSPWCPCPVSRTTSHEPVSSRADHPLGGVPLRTRRAGAVELRASWMRRARAVLTLGRRLDKPRGQRLREALEELGPIFVKFGQVLSTRSDLMPPDVAEELARLQDRVPPFDSQIAVDTIERAFRKKLDQIFVSFEREPVASASIAQVHFAVISDRNGVQRDVAVRCCARA